MSSSPRTISPKLTLGPVLFNWQQETWRDFYYKIADEAPIDTVYMGDIICAKRAALINDKVREDVVARLQSAGKNVVQSTIILVIDEIDDRLLNANTAQTRLPVEVNDMTAVAKINNRNFYIGPYLNIYNEEALLAMIKLGAIHYSIPFELSGESIAILADIARKNSITSEVMVYGRVPLSVSNRCYHAQAYGRDRQGCLYACKCDPDGKTVADMDGHDFLVINGKQTMTHTCINLIREIPDMINKGVTHFRLSPHSCDMVLVAEIFNGIINKSADIEHSIKTLKEFGFGTEFSNGYYYNRPGHEWVEAA